MNLSGDTRYIDPKDNPPTYDDISAYRPPPTTQKYADMISELPPASVLT